MNRFRQRIWQAPRSVFERDTDRKASFLELFYDLVFVVTIATLTHGLSAHLDLNGILSYIFLFIPVWWAWNNGTFYHDIHGNNDVRDRFFHLPANVRRCGHGRVYFTMAWVIRPKHLP